MGGPPVVDAAPGDLAARAAQLVRPGAPRVLLGLAGAPGSGKSTLAGELVRAVPASVVLPMDGFHLPTDRLVELGAVERRGAPDTFDAAGFVVLLERVRGATGDVPAPDFDRGIEEPVPDAVLIAATARLVVVEGNYLLLDEPPWSAVRGLLDAVWFVEVPEPVRVARLVARFVAYGWDAAAADARVRHGSDARNAALVAATRRRADAVVRPVARPAG